MSAPPSMWDFEVLQWPYGQDPYGRPTTRASHQLLAVWGAYDPAAHWRPDDLAVDYFAARHWQRTVLARMAVEVAPVVEAAWCEPCWRMPRRDRLGGAPSCHGPRVGPPALDDASHDGPINLEVAVPTSAAKKIARGLRQTLTQLVEQYPPEAAIFADPPRSALPSAAELAAWDQVSDDEPEGRP